MYDLKFKTNNFPPSFKGKGGNAVSVWNLRHRFYSSWFQTKAGKVIGLEFEIISKLDSYFLMTVIELELLHNYPQNYSKPWKDDLYMSILFLDQVGSKFKW